MTKPPLARLFSPRSVAIIGGRVAASVVVELDKLGFTGDIWPVNPRRPKMASRKCYASLADLPGTPDCAYVAVAREETIGIVAALSAAGAGGAICHASGFSEVGEDGKGMTGRLLEVAGEMPVLGPNCWGILNLLDKTALWPDFHGAVPAKRGVAIINQSGNMAINYTMQRRGLPLGMLVTLGNQAMIDANDCLETFLADDRIKAIGLHIEGLSDISRFSALAIKAHKAGKPIVVLKTGASAKGARAAASHTATLVGSDTLYDALFQRYGIARTHSVPGFLETLKLLTVTGPLKGNRIASLSCSGGEASLIADRAVHRDLVFPDLDKTRITEVRGTLNEFVDVTNPLDFHTFIWGKRDQMTATFAAMMRGKFDMTALIIDYPREDRSRVKEYDVAINAWIAAKNLTGANAAMIATLPECLPERVALKLMAKGIVPFAGMEEALDAIEAAFHAGSNPVHDDPLMVPGLPPADAKPLDEHEAKLLLAEYGLHIPRGIACSSDKAGAVAAKLAFPVAVKALSPSLTHKTERGAVRLNIKSGAEVTIAAREMRAVSTQILIEEMVIDPVAELIIGISRDPQFGLYLVIGAGGVLVELLKDTATLLLPASRQDIATALDKLSIAPLLNGFRGRPKGDISAVIKAIGNVQKFATSHADTLTELDINPLIVRPEGTSAIVADALIIMGE